jgi:hypothetical protein
MNERIRELALQASGGSHYLHSHGEPLQKFGLLLIRQCARAANDWYQNHESLHWDPATHILAEFGVEEE